MAENRESDNRILEIVNARRIIEGPSDKFMAINPVKYPWAIELFENMMHNEWFPRRINMKKDSIEYRAEGNSGIRLGVDRALAFLTNLDAIQVENLTYNIINHITDPTIKMCMYRQIWEEALHVFSYSYCIESVCESQLQIYDMYRVDAVLREKNDFVMAQAFAMKNEGFTPENFVYALVSNIILEGVYFHSGFLYFYVLEKLHRKFLGIANMIQYIQRDETSHVVLFTNIFNTMRVERPEIFTDEVKENIIKLFDAGVKLETAWGQHIIEKGVAGLTNSTVEDYIMCLADERLSDIGLPKQYKRENPYPWVKEISVVNSSEKNFFESKPTDYSKETLQFSEDDD